MVDVVVKQIKKYTGYELNKKELAALQETLTKQKYINKANFIGSLLLLARVNYYVPKILNYFNIEWKDTNNIVFSNKKVELKVNILDIIKNEQKIKDFAKALMVFTDTYIGDFNKYVKRNIKITLSNVVVTKDTDNIDYNALLAEMFLDAVNSYFSEA